MKKDKKPVPEIQLDLRVLGYEEDGDWIAHCLEMDIRGYGKDFDEAFADLYDLVRMQVGFAVQRNELCLLDQPAETKYIMAFEDTRRRVLVSPLEVAVAEESYPIRCMPLPPKKPTCDFALASA